MPKTILFVEPDHFLAKTYETQLIREGYRVVHLPHGERVATIAASEKPDLILLALALPKKDGFEVLEELQTNMEVRQIPIVIFSRIGSKDIIERCTEYGACDYLIKAHHGPEDVLACIRKRIG